MAEKLYKEVITSNGQTVLEEINKIDLKLKRSKMYDSNDDLLIVYNSDYLLDPDVNESNKIIIYSKIFQTNIVGILFKSEDDVEKYMLIEDLILLKHEDVSYGHYLQLERQVGKTYWNTGQRIFYFSDNRPFVGAMRIKIVEKGLKYFALVTVCDC